MLGLVNGKIESHLKILFRAYNPPPPAYLILSMFQPTCLLPPPPAPPRLFETQEYVF